MTVFNRARHLSAGTKTSSPTVGLALPKAEGLTYSELGCGGVE